MAAAAARRARSPARRARSPSPTRAQSPAARPRSRRTRTVDAVATETTVTAAGTTTTAVHVHATATNGATTKVAVAGAAVVEPANGHAGTKPHRRLLFFHELEEWRKDNHWILSGYRVSDRSYWTSFDSLFFLHNETGNVYSHLIGGLIFVGIAIYTYLCVDMALPFDKAVFGVFFAGAFFCLFVSAFFHLVSNHSYEVALIWNRCDYAGITFMIVGSSFPLIYFAFNCHPHMQVAALAFIILLGLASLPIVLLERFSKPKWRPIRSMLYVGLGCSGIAPMLYLAWEVGWAHVYNATALHWTATMGALYIVGAVLYALRVPERHFPGKFDYFFHSHQIFHLCVLFAAIVHWIGLLEAYQWHLSTPCKSPHL